VHAGPGRSGSRSNKQRHPPANSEVATPSSLSATHPAGGAIAGRGSETLEISGEWDSYPNGGLHVDAGAKAVLLWSASEVTDGARRLRDAWPGWRTRYAGEDFEAHPELLQGKLRIHPPDRDRLVETARAIALQEPSDASGLLGRIVGAFERDGQTVDAVHPSGDRDSPPNLPEGREAVLDAIVARLSS
jgi:hypothetical protein